MLNSHEKIGAPKILMRKIWDPQNTQKKIFYPQLPMMAFNIT